MALITLAGNISRDVEIRMVGDTQVAVFSVPDNEWRNGEQQTTWFNCTVWEPREFVKRLKKGDNIQLSGSFAPRTYEKDGTSRVSFDVRVFGDSVRYNAGNRQRTDADATTASNDDDQPF